MTLWNISDADILAMARSIVTDPKVRPVKVGRTSGEYSYVRLSDGSYVQVFPWHFTNPAARKNFA